MNLDLIQKIIQCNNNNNNNNNKNIKNRHLYIL